MRRHYHRPDKVTREVVEASQSLQQFFTWPDYSVLNNWLSEVMERRGPNAHLYIQQFLVDKRLDLMRRGVNGRLHHKWPCNPGELKKIEEGVPWAGYPHLKPNEGVEKFVYNRESGEWNDK